MAKKAVVIEVPPEQKRKNLIRMIRNAIRFKHSLAADNQIDRMLPKYLTEFDRAVAHGESFELDTATLLAELDNEDLSSRTGA